MAQPYVTSPITDTSGENFLLNVGDLFYNPPNIERIKAGLPYEELANILDEWKHEGYSFGARTGGGSLTINHNLEPLESDGITTPTQGMMRGGAIDVEFSSTIQEITIENIKRLIPMAYEDDDGWMTSHNQVLREHFKTILWAGTLNDGRIMLVKIIGAFPTSEFALGLSEANTGSTVPFTFRGHAANLAQMRRGAYGIMFIGMDDPVAASAMQFIPSSEMLAAEAKLQKAKSIVSIATETAKAVADKARATFELEKAQKRMEYVGSRAAEPLTEAPSVSLDRMTTAQLRSLAQEKGIDIPYDITRRDDIAKYLAERL